MGWVLRIRKGRKDEFRQAKLRPGGCAGVL
jgi:hypothetical protein